MPKGQLGSAYRHPNLDPLLVQTLDLLAEANAAGLQKKAFFDHLGISRSTGQAWARGHSPSFAILKLVLNELGYDLVIVKKEPPRG